MSKPGVVRFLYTQNPFYLIGTAILLYGLRIATDSGSYFTDQPYLLPIVLGAVMTAMACLLYTSPSPRDGLLSRMPSSA